MTDDMRAAAIEALAAACAVDADQITDDTTLASLNAGSIQLVSACSTIEDAADIDLPLRDVLKCATVGEFLIVVEEHLD